MGQFSSHAVRSGVQNRLRARARGMIYTICTGFSTGRFHTFTMITTFRTMIVVKPSINGLKTGRAIVGAGGPEAQKGPILGPKIGQKQRQERILGVKKGLPEGLGPQIPPFEGFWLRRVQKCTLKKGLLASSNLPKMDPLFSRYLFKNPSFGGPGRPKMAYFGPFQLRVRKMGSFWSFWGPK